MRDDREYEYNPDDAQYWIDFEKRTVICHDPHFGYVDLSNSREGCSIWEDVRDLIKDLDANKVIDEKTYNDLMYSLYRYMSIPGSHWNG